MSILLLCNICDKLWYIIIISSCNFNSILEEIDVNTSPRSFLPWTWSQIRNFQVPIQSPLKPAQKLQDHPRKKRCICKDTETAVPMKSFLYCCYNNFLSSNWFTKNDLIHKFLYRLFRLCSINRINERATLNFIYAVLAIKLSLYAIISSCNFNSILEEIDVNTSPRSFLPWTWSQIRTFQVPIQSPLKPAQKLQDHPRKKRCICKDTETAVPMKSFLYWCYNNFLSSNWFTKNDLIHKFLYRLFQFFN